MWACPGIQSSKESRYQATYYTLLARQGSNIIVDSSEKGPVYLCDRLLNCWQTYDLDNVPLGCFFQSVPV